MRGQPALFRRREARGRDQPQRGLDLCLVHRPVAEEQAALLEVWKGPFSDATDMWYERGEPQTSRAMGAGAVSSERFRTMKRVPSP